MGTSNCVYLINTVGVVFICSWLHLIERSKTSVFCLSMSDVYYWLVISICTFYVLLFTFYGVPCPLHDPKF